MGHARPLKWFLIALVVATVVLRPTSSTELSPEVQANLIRSIENHLAMREAHLRAKAIDEHPLLAGHPACDDEAEGGSSRPAGRALKTVPTPAVIRILSEYQLPSTMASDTQASIRDVVASAIATIQTYIKVKVPVDSNGLLAPARYITAATCTPLTGPAVTCDGPGFQPGWPGGGGMYPATDIKYPTCNVATYNASHILGPACYTAAGPTYVPTSNCYTNAAGGTGGAATDMYMYVTADAQSCQTGTAAYATPCLFDLTTNRPVIGMLNICPVALTSYTPNQLLSTIMHEITHAMGFASSMYPIYVDNSNNMLGTPNVVTGGSGNRAPFNMIITPTVVTEVRAQFGCNTLLGAPLEDGGGAASADSHWEMELFQGDFMTPTKVADASYSRYSRISLALMEDTGWYVGNWSNAYYLDWGRNAGCAFVQNTCANYMATTTNQAYFCDVADHNPTCTFSGLARGACVTNTFTTCGISTAFTSASGKQEPSCLSYLYTNADDAATEAAGNSELGWAIGTPASRCLKATLPFSGAPGVDIPANPYTTTGYCFTAACSGGVLTFQIHGTTYTCTPGATSAVSTFNALMTSGTVSCPRDIAAYCRTLDCPAAGCSSFGGNCFEGQCVCRLGFYGSTCESTTYEAALANIAPPPPPVIPSPVATTVSLFQSIKRNITTEGLVWLIVGAAALFLVPTCIILGAIYIAYCKKDPGPPREEQLTPSFMVPSASPLVVGDGSPMRGGYSGYATPSIASTSPDRMRPSGGYRQTPLSSYEQQVYQPPPPIYEGRVSSGW